MNYTPNEPKYFSTIYFMIKSFPSGLNCNSWQILCNIQLTLAPFPMHLDSIFLRIIVHIVIVTIHIILVLQFAKHIRVELGTILDYFFIREYTF